MKAIGRTLATGLILSIVGIFIVGCETPWADSDSSPQTGSSSIVGNIKTFETTGVVYARALDEVITVTLSTTGQSVQTDADGNFTLTGVPAGEHDLFLSFNGITQVYTVTVYDDCCVVLSNLEILASGVVQVGSVNVIPNGAVAADDDDDDEDEDEGDDDEEIVVAEITPDPDPVPEPINVTTNLDQSQLSNNTGAEIGDFDVVQTFTAGVDGDLVSVEVAIGTGTATDYTVEIITSGGDSLGSCTIAAADMSWHPNLTAFEFGDKITLEAGTEYGIKVTASDVETPEPAWRGNNGDAYDGGQLEINGTAFPGYDMVFSTYMAVAE